jgi:hypothetical protein
MVAISPFFGNAHIQTSHTQTLKPSNFTNISNHLTLRISPYSTIHKEYDVKFIEESEDPYFGSVFSVGGGPELHSHFGESNS